MNNEFLAATASIGIKARLALRFRAKLRKKNGTKKMLDYY
jgi:hypothetical protein